MIDLVLCEPHQPRLDALRQVFHGEPGVEISSQDESAFIARGDLDALLMPPMLAHELFGGKPVQKLVEVSVDERTGRHTWVQPAQILATDGRRPSLTAPWVVVSPALPGHPDLLGHEQVAVVPDDATVTTEEQLYLIFSLALETIERFKSQQGPAIQRLGCILDQFGIPAGSTDETMRRDLQGIQRAYRDYRASQSEHRNP